MEAAKTQIPENFKERLHKLEEKADEKLPGDYTIEANFFTDGTTHLVAVYNYSEDYSERLHEGQEEPTITGCTNFGGVKVPARLGRVWHRQDSQSGQDSSPSS